MQSLFHNFSNYKFRTKAIITLCLHKCRKIHSIFFISQKFQCKIILSTYKLKHVNRRSIDMIYITTGIRENTLNKSVYRTCHLQLNHFLILLSIASHYCQCLSCFKNTNLASYAKMVHLKYCKPITSIFVGI